MNIYRLLINGEKIADYETELAAFDSAAEPENNLAENTIQIETIYAGPDPVPGTYYRPNTIGCCSSSHSVFINDIYPFTGSGYGYPDRATLYECIMDIDRHTDREKLVFISAYKRTAAGFSLHINDYDLNGRVLDIGPLIDIERDMFYNAKAARDLEEKRSNLLTINKK